MSMSVRVCMHMCMRAFECFPVIPITVDCICHCSLLLCDRHPIIGEVLAEHESNCL